jgi:hypothetical protein
MEATDRIHAPAQTTGGCEDRMGQYDVLACVVMRNTRIGLVRYVCWLNML